MENGESESRCLASTGLRDAQNIPAGEKLGDGLRLDGRWDDVVSGIQRTYYRIGQAEFRE